MPVPKEHPVTEEWRRRMLQAMRDQGIGIGDLAYEIGTSRATISYVLTRGHSSIYVPSIEAALTGHAKVPRVEDDPTVVAEAATLREARDAVTGDIARLELARGTIEQRLVEAYQGLAEIDVKITELRARRACTEKTALDVKITELRARRACTEKTALDVKGASE